MWVGIGTRIGGRRHSNLYYCFLIFLGIFFGPLLLYISFWSLVAAIVCFLFLIAIRIIQLMLWTARITRRRRLNNRHAQPVEQQVTVNIFQQDNFNSWQWQGHGPDYDPNKIITRAFALYFGTNTMPED